MKIVSTTSKQRIWAYNAPVFGVKKGNSDLGVLINQNPIFGQYSGELYESVLRILPWEKLGGRMHPAGVDPSIAWAVWAVMIVGNFLMAVIGTWLIARGWEE